MGVKAGPCYAIDSDPPEGYLAWHQWAHDMTSIHKVKQRQCPRCKLWKFPQERTDVKEQHSLLCDNGKIRKQMSFVCNSCMINGYVG